MSTSLMKSQVGASIVQPRSVVSAFTPFAFSPDPVRGSAQRSASPFDTAGISPYFSALDISIDETGDNRLRTVSSGRHASSGSENAAVDICSSPTIAATSSRCSPAEESDHGAHIHQIGEEGPAHRTATSAEFGLLLQAGCKGVMQASPVAVLQKQDLALYLFYFLSLSHAFVLIDAQPNLSRRHTLRLEETPQQSLLL